MFSHGANIHNILQTYLLFKAKFVGCLKISDWISGNGSV